MSTQVTAVRGKGLHAKTVPATVARLPELLADPDVVVWVELDSADKDARRLLEEVFQFHPLLVEDALADATTPKIESFGNYVYLIVHGLSDADPTGDGEVHTADLDLFIGKNYVITHTKTAFAALELTRESVARDPGLLARGPFVVAHAIIDRLVDEYLPLMEKLDTEVDAIEAAILKEATPALLERIFRMKHSLQRIRRVGTHQKNLLFRMARGEIALVPEDARPFFSDVYDHMVRVTDMNDVYRELMASTLDAYLSMQSHKLSEVMRVLTIFSTMMLPLTFITGLYGMNFDYMPYLHFDYGFHLAVIIMLGLAASMIVYFRIKRWL